MITLSEEVNVIWCRNWNTMTWLYAFTRYSTVVLSVLVFVPTGTAIKVRQFQVASLHYTSSYLDYYNRGIVNLLHRTIT